MAGKIVAVISIVALSLCVIGWLGLGGDRGLNEVLRLLDAGVGDEVIKAHITSKGMVFDLSAKDIARLKKAGAGDELIRFMITGGSSGFPFELDDGLFVGGPVTHGHLAVFPAFTRKATEVGDYMSLDEAQRKGLITITERGGGSVPTVLIRNSGKRPIFIVAGEIIIGGKQDRMISHDVLIPAGEELEVSVRCVEQGRWMGETPVFKSGGALGSRGVRAALQFKAQQDVWSEVSKACEEHEAQSESGTYRTILTSGDIDEKSKPFLDALNRGLRGDNLVGLVMAINGEVICVDIFASPKFFARVKEKLLKAYVLDALGTPEKTTRPPGRSEIISFFRELEDAERDRLSNYGANSNTRLESESVIGSESRDEEGLLQHLNLYRR